jgi:hypothetical protein
MRGFAVYWSGVELRPDRNAAFGAGGSGNT